MAAKAAAHGNWEANNLPWGETRAHGDQHRRLFRLQLDAADKPAALKFSNTAISTQTETIEVRKLDDVCGKLSGSVLLKIDTQGYERQVLKGA